VKSPITDENLLHQESALKE
jgi:hypothetical protein